MAAFETLLRDWLKHHLLHCATGFDDSRYARHMHRTTLEGDTPYYRDGQRVTRSAIASRP
jgi:hypothetical protein